MSESLHNRDCTCGLCVPFADDQRKRDEEAAESALFRHKEEAKFCCEHCFNVAFRDEVVVAFKRGFSKALAHCRETEVKERNDYITKATELWVTKLESLEEQLRVAVEALRKAKSRYWERCYDGSGNTRALTLNEFDAEVDCALQKIEAMKGGGDERRN